jgi:hypothetical protein
LASCVATAFALVHPALSSPLQAQALACDTTVATESSDPYRYRNRGSRCEGRYLAPLSGATLSVVGYTSATSWRGPVKTSTLQLSWPKRSETILVRAVSLRWRTFYRMNTVVASGVNTYDWPTNVLRPLGLTSQEVGVLASYRVTIAGRPSRVLVPLTVADGEAPTVSDLTVTLISDIDLDEVKLMIHPLSNGASPAITPPVRPSTYIARRPLVFPLPKLLPGYYLLMFIASGDRRVVTADAVIDVPSSNP